MIVTSIDDFHRYQKLHSGFAAVEDALRNLSVATIREGRTEIVGEDVFVIGAPGASTRPMALLEAHRRYIDIQVILSGTDTMGWAPLATCHTVDQTYDPERDIVFFRDPFTSVVAVPARCLTIFFPEDAHAPLLGGGELVDKCVFKIRV